MAWHVVIAGGGFGGLYAARTLEHRLPPHSTRITLVNDVNFMLYTPLLPGAAGGALEPRHVVVPLREHLDRSDLRLAKVVGAEPGRDCLRVRGPAGHVEELRYDHLIVALGSVSRTLPIPGLAEHGIGFKTLPQAIALRNRLLRTLETAENLDDLARRREYLTYVFVGAGYAGLEGVAALQDLAAEVLDRYPRCAATGMRWLLVEARERVMQEAARQLGEHATRELRGRGIEVRTSTTVEHVTERSVTLQGGELVPTRTLVWTAGVRPHPVVSRLGLPVEGFGRLRVDRRLRVEGHANVWAVGDAAAVPDPAKGCRQPTPPTAQHALRQGRVAARNVAATIGTGRTRPFRYRTKGFFAELGRGEGVAATMGIRWRGLPAFLLTRTYHLAMMPGAGRRWRLLADWNVGLLFGRDTAELGQLGSPPSLAGEVGDQSAGGTPGEATPGGEAGSGAATLSRCPWPFACD